MVYALGPFDASGLTEHFLPQIHLGSKRFDALLHYLVKGVQALIIDMLIRLRPTTTPAARTSLIILIVHKCKLVLYVSFTRERLPL